MIGLVFLRPWWLAALPVLAAIALYVWRRGPEAGGWERVMPPAMLSAMVALGHLATVRSRQTRFAALTAAAFMVLGLAGPAIPRANVPVFVGSGVVLIAIDMSPSVASGPALADAQAAAAQVMTAAQGRQVGLIVYAGEAYPVAAPTSDPANLETLIAVLSANTMPDRGSRPATALSLARRMLKDTTDAELVLISDGGGFDDTAKIEAGRLASAGVGISALVLSGAAGGRADVDALTELANVSAPARSPEPVLARIETSGAPGSQDMLASVRFRDIGPLMAALALLPLLVLFRRQG
ncbi:hypothetical protein HDIA_1830 [Hartmannibacter diazotrophicus]|uniref:VWFA domain-containing protein n=1 Tax=Hartmannibacter diazotrophicus TaxID=1482074 RepID=A0A2C9D6J9_9HYPH|nr:VWA domain-containing protein [Hartmannibacter diazotrophicus]SON55371.1 hypothetical protein HDIA_1830 [Hartmannibacter diazotrophicus]